MTKKNAEQFNRMRDALLNIANESPSCSKMKSQAKGAGEYKKSLEKQYSEMIDLAKQAIGFVRAIQEKAPGKRGPKPKLKKAGVNANNPPQSKKMNRAIQPYQEYSPV